MSWQFDAQVTPAVLTTQVGLPGQTTPALVRVQLVEGVCAGAVLAGGVGAGVVPLVGGGADAGVVPVVGGGVGSVVVGAGVVVVGSGVAPLGGVPADAAGTANPNPAATIRVTVHVRAIISAPHLLIWLNTGELAGRL